jgi:hypothetical protein
MAWRLACRDAMKHKKPKTPGAPYGDEPHAPELRKVSEDYRQRLIAAENSRMLQRRESFRRVAEALAKRLAEIPAVTRIVLFGSTVAPPRKELPRSGRFRRAGIEVWHECRDVNLAVWVSDLQCLEKLIRERRAGLAEMLARKKVDLDEKHVDILVMQAEDDCLGTLCWHDQCPSQGKYDCFNRGCGTPPFVRPMRRGRFHAARVPADRKMMLYEREAQDRPERGDGGSDEESQPSV